MKIFLIVLFVIVIAALIVLFICGYFGLLEFYHKKPKKRPNTVKIACVGDSITYGCMLANRNKNNYPDTLGRTLGDGYSVGNFGYTNRTADENGDYPLTREKLYADSLSFGADKVILLLGSNDSKKKNWNPESFKRSLKKIIGDYRELPSKPEIFLVTPPPAFKVGKKVMYDLDGETIKNEIYPAVCEVADDTGVTLIDAFKMFEGKSEMFADGVHFNRAGVNEFVRNIIDVVR